MKVKPTYQELENEELIIATIQAEEKEVLMLICQGYSNIEIGKNLFISPKTIDKHRCNLISKTKTKNSATLVMFAIKHKLIEIQAFNKSEYHSKHYLFLGNYL